MAAGDRVSSIACPYCQRKLPQSAEHAGRVVTCPGCHKRFRLPLSASPEGLGDEAGSPGDGPDEPEAIEIPRSVLETVPEAVARQYGILPVAIEGDTLTILISEPPTPEIVERLRSVLGRPFSTAQAPQRSIRAAIDRHYAPAGMEVGGAAQGAPEDEQIDFVEVADSEKGSEQFSEVLDPDSAPVVRTVQSMIREGLKLGASRILVLPMRDRLKVVYRIQDVVLPGEGPPPEMLYPVLVRLMTMANLSGHIKVRVGKREKRLHTVFKPARHGLSAIIEMGQDTLVIDICRARAAKLGYRFVDLSKVEVPPAVVAAVPERVARENQVLPVSLDGDALTVAIADPRAEDLLDRLRFLLNRPISVVMAPEGAVLAGIEHFYGPSDPEAADLTLWELAQVPETPVDGGRPGADGLAQAAGAADDLAVRPFLDHLHTLYRDKMFGLFEELRRSAKLCRKDDPVAALEQGKVLGPSREGPRRVGKLSGEAPDSGDLEVVFPQSHVMSLLPDEARRYVEDKIWVLREAILSRLEHFLERDHVARGVAMTYSLYLACCRLAGGQPASVNPASTTDAWINFLYALVVRSFPSIQSNGALLSFVNEHSDQLAAKIASLLDDASCVVDPASARDWLARLQRQTTTDEPVDFDSPPIVHRLELLIAEAAHVGASRVVLLPRADRVEVAVRVQKAVYRREGLPLRLLFPVLARLRILADPSGALRMAVGGQPRDLRVVFRSAEQGPAARIEIVPEEEAVEACRAQAARMGYAFVQLEDIEVPAALLKRIPEAVAWKKKVLPLSLEEGTLAVALGVPPTARRLDELRLVFNRPISVVMAPQPEILAAIYRHYHPAGAEGPVSPEAAALLMR